MPFSAVPTYLSAKFQRECYELNCLWAGATGFNFQKTNEPQKPARYRTWPTLEQWPEYSRPKVAATPAAASGLSEEDIFAEIEAMAMAEEGRSGAGR